MCVHTAVEETTVSRLKLKMGLLQRAVCSFLADVVLEIKLLCAEIDNYISVLAETGHRDSRRFSAHRGTQMNSPNGNFATLSLVQN